MPTTLRVTLNLPPGWRLFALFGADWVRGDWLTAWTLLDLFSAADFHARGVPDVGSGRRRARFFRLRARLSRARRAALTSGSSCLIPLALLRVVPEGRGRKLVAVAKWICIVAFVLIAVPFVAKQVQQALYPQLELPAAA